MKSYEMGIRITKKLANGEMIIKKKAELNHDENLKISDLKAFNKKLKDLLKEIKKAERYGYFLESHLCVREYTKDDTTNHIVSQKHDRWYYEGTPEHIGGFYLRPDHKFCDRTDSVYITYEYPLRDIMCL